MDQDCYDSRKEASEVGNNAINEIRRIMHGFNSRFTFDNARCVERYIEGEAAILCHFLVEGFDVEFVARFQGKKFVSGPNKERRELDLLEAGLLSKEHLDVNRYIDPLKERACASEELMLVGLVQHIELPKCVALPVFVRFGCVDCIYNFLPNALYLSASRSWVTRGAPADRVIHNPIRLRAASGVQDQLIGNMVQGASEILNYVGGNGCQFVGNRGRFDEVINALSSLRIFFDSASIRIGVVKRPDRKLKVLDMLFGPCDFRLNAVNDLAHG